MNNYEYQQILTPPTTKGELGYDPSLSISDGAAAWAFIALIIAIVGGILTYFLFVKKADQPKSKFALWLKNFLSFKIMWIEPILKIVYYFATIFVILFSFSLLSMGAGGVVAFFMLLILGPISIRLVYEALIMFVMIWRNTRDIAENTKKE